MELRNYKIRVNSPAESEMVQRASFEYGYYWRGTGKKIYYSDNRFLFFDECGSITFSKYRDIFTECCDEEISVVDFLMLKSPKWDANDVFEWYKDCQLAHKNNEHIKWWDVQECIPNFSIDLDNAGYQLFLSWKSKNRP